MRARICAASSLNRQWSFWGLSEAASDSSKQYMTEVTSWITWWTKTTDQFQWNLRELKYQKSEVPPTHYLRKYWLKAQNSTTLCKFFTNEVSVIGEVFGRIKLTKKEGTVEEIKKNDVYNSRIQHIGYDTHCLHKVQGIRSHCGSQIWPYSKACSAVSSHGCMTSPKTQQYF